MWSSPSRNQENEAVEAEIVGRECKLTLSREELVLLIGVMTGVNTAVNSDEYFAELVGATREEVRMYSRQIADLARAIPYEH
jgi:hypothetical protein